MSTVTLSHNDPVRLAPALAARIQTALLAALIAASAGCIAGAVYEPSRFFGSYLVALLFVLSIALGALFWVMLHHLTGAIWSVVIRRVMEQFCRTIPWLGLLFLPIVFGMSHLYSWTDAGHLADPVLRAKQPYLNVPFFLIRATGYFAVWSWLALRMSNWSLRQDLDGNVEWTVRMRNLSGVGVLLLAVTSTFAAFDWIMSLDPHWYSTIFGIYFWSGSIIGSLAAIVALVMILRSVGLLVGVVTQEHLHDLGKLLFGFAIFWAYIAFSQYFLIWYANIPEETIWYIRRLKGNWSYVGVALSVGHFVIPFIILLSRSAKRNPSILGSAAVVVLCFHYLDLYWQIMPELQPHGPDLHWIDASTLVGIVASCGLVILHGARRDALIPIRDPQLHASLQSLSE